MNSNAAKDRVNAAHRSGSRVGASFICAVLWLCGCASAVDAPDRLPATANLPEGQGTLVGSILLVVPTGVLDKREREMIDSLTAKKYEATIGKFIIHDYGIAETVEHPGSRYRVAFDAGIEKRFVIRAPAGRYSVQEITQIRSSGWHSGAVCTMHGVANFSIHAGKTTYVGQLTIVADLNPDQDSKFLRGYRKGLVNQTGLPEAALDMAASATDRAAATLRELGMADSDESVATELMITDTARNIWHCAVPPPQPLPGALRPPGP